MTTADGRSSCGIRKQENCWVAPAGVGVSMIVCGPDWVNALAALRACASCLLTPVWFGFTASKHKLGDRGVPVPVFQSRERSKTWRSALLRPKLRVFGKTCSYRQMRVARRVISLALPCCHRTNVSNKTSWMLWVPPLLLVAFSSFSLKFGWNGHAQG